MVIDRRHVGPRWQTKRLGSALALACACSAATGSEVPIRDLPLPPSADSAEMVLPTVTGYSRDSLGSWWAVSGRQRVLVRGKYNPDGKSKEERWGQLLDAERFEIPKEGEGSLWHGLTDTPRALIALDGANLALMALDRTTGQEISRRAVPWDTIRPPRDRGGEGTRLQIARFREKFARALRESPDVKWVGIAPVPREWLPTSRPLAFFVATRIPGFPVLALSCDDSDSSLCVVERACDMPTLASHAPSHEIAGIAVDSTQRKIVLGHAAGHRLIVLKFSSCLASRVAEILPLPPRLKTLTHLHIDTEGALHVSTLAPDDYENASVFRWPTW